MAGKVLRNPKRGHCLAPLMTPAQVAEIRLSDESYWLFAKRNHLPPEVVYKAAVGKTWRAMLTPAPRPCMGARTRLRPLEGFFRMREIDGTLHGGRVAWWEIDLLREAAEAGALPRR